jgi:hypothetical protein
MRADDRQTGATPGRQVLGGAGATELLCQAGQAALAPEALLVVNDVPLVVGGGLPGAADTRPRARFVAARTSGGRVAAGGFHFVPGACMVAAFVIAVAASMVAARCVHGHGVHDRRTAVCSQARVGRIQRGPGHQRVCTPSSTTRSPAPTSTPAPGSCSPRLWLSCTTRRPRSGGASAWRTTARPRCTCAQSSRALERGCMRGARLELACRPQPVRTLRAVNSRVVRVRHEWASPCTTVRARVLVSHHARAGLARWALPSHRTRRSTGHP